MFFITINTNNTYISTNTNDDIDNDNNNGNNKKTKKKTDSDMNYQCLLSDSQILSIVKIYSHLIKLRIYCFTNTRRPNGH